MNEALNGGAPAPTSEPANPAAAQSNAATANPQTDGGDDGENLESGAQRTFTQKELDEIVSKRVAKAESRTERRILRTLERLPLGQQTARQPQGQPENQPNDGRPLRSQFQSEDEWLDARDAWRDRQAESQQRQRTVATKAGQVLAAAAKLPGFDSDAFADVTVTDAMMDAILDSDVGAKLVHHLASHPDEAERIAKLSPGRQGAEIGKLELKVAETKPPARSNAPTALPGAKGSPGANSMPDPSDTKAWVRWANEQERAARR